MVDEGPAAVLSPSPVPRPDGVGSAGSSANARLGRGDGGGSVVTPARVPMREPAASTRGGRPTRGEPAWGSGGGASSGW